MDHPLKVLVVDDAEENVSLLARFLANLGHTPIVAHNGAQAVRLFESESPDLVLMDVMMPEMDGFEATARIKALCGTRWVPIIFLTALAQADNLVKGLESGGDDYLTKPINLVVLRAKIRAMQRIAAMQRQIEEKKDELERYYYQAQEENRVGSYIMDHIVKAHGLQDELLTYWITPAQDFSGDLVAAARTPGNTLHVMLADGTGHGLSAALNVLPLTQIFYSMTEKGFPLSSIVEELNHKINTLMPADRFVAATLAAIDTRNHILEIWNGGNPAPVFINDQGTVLHRWESRHLPLGILHKEQFESHTESFNWESGVGQLFFCSDGLLEAQDQAGTQFGAERMLQTLASAAPEARFTAILQALEAHLDKHGAHDDLTLIMIKVLSEEILLANEVEAARHPRLDEKLDLWRLGLNFGAAELRYLDVVPMLMNIMEQMKSLQAHSSAVFLILSELYNNALDHGLLELDSGMKGLPGGFEQYLKLREERLAALAEGHIEVNFERTELDGQPMLKIQVKDSGHGFHHDNLLNTQMRGNAGLHGRGIALVRTLCVKLEYLGCGNEAVAYCHL